jgi:hypothetical protein
MTDRDILEQIEQCLNDFGAELTVQKIILQLFVTRIMVSIPTLSEEMLEEMRADVIGVLERQPINPKDDPAGQQRSKALSIQHGERFFRELATALSAMRNKDGQSGRN